MSLYYKIWIDAIVKIKRNSIRREDWKWLVQVYMAIAMTLNLMFLFAILQRNIVHNTFYDLDINLFSSRILNNLISVFILFFFPPLIINYLLIFKNNKYISLIEKYKREKGNPFFLYFFTSLFVPLLVLVIGFVLR
jgi:hypothetical protein